MEDEEKSVESVMKEGMRRLLIRVAKRERKMSPEKQFDKHFLFLQNIFFLKKEPVLRKFVRKGTNPRGGES